MSLVDKERRRRFRKPGLLLGFSILILLLPVSNYIGMSMKYNFPFYAPYLLLRYGNLPEWILLVSSILSGLGLLFIKRWGWWLFILSSFTFISYNSYGFITIPNSASKGPLIQTLIITAALCYFLQKDIFTPYMKLYKRGWRFLKRYPIVTNVNINDKIYKTENISMGGIFVKWTDCNLKLNSEVTVYFELSKESFKAKAGIATIVPGKGVGIAFREIDNFFKERLKKALLLAKITDHTPSNGS
ncbi:MAG: PilZ domain-containing protein [Leptospiraceae bacterium]|nr:PilZ domain-containing protein [Leptospiraceae bacterium]